MQIASAVMDALGQSNYQKIVRRKSLFRTRDKEVTGMPNASRVIEALERCIMPDLNCEGCSYYDECGERPHALDNDIIAILKGRQTKAIIEGGGSTWWYVCDECHTAIDRKDKFCRECGRELMWNAKKLLEVVRK